VIDRPVQHGAISPDVALDDALQVLGLQRPIDGAVRIDLYHRAEATRAQAPCLGEVNLAPFAFIDEPLLLGSKPAPKWGRTTPPALLALANQHVMAAC
jgi:hypothetical protein